MTQTVAVRAPGLGMPAREAHAEVGIYADPMPALKAWAQADPYISAVNGDRAFLATPRGYSENPPETWVVLTLLDVEDDGGDAPFEYPTVQIDCYGRTGERAGALRAAVRTAIGSVVRPVEYGGVVIHAAEPLNGGTLWAPDPQPKYTTTVRFMVRAATSP